MSLELANKTGRQVGDWHLDTFVRASHDRADYIATNGGSRVRLELMLADSEEAEQALKGWDTARQLSHENLIHIYECGTIAIDGSRFVYSASELPDDDLGEILTDRSLELDEARAMSSATASVLAYLHERSLQLGAVSPTNMMIVGQDVKLGGAGIEAAGDHGRQSDLQQFGMTLLQALGGASASEARSLPHPFDAIVNGCLDPGRTGWTAESVLAALEAKAPVEPPREASRSVQRRAEEQQQGSNRKWLVAGTAVLALVGVVSYRSQHPAAKTPAPPPKSEPAPVAAPVIPKPSPVPSSAKGATRPPAKTPHAQAASHSPAKEATQTADRSKAAPQSPWAVIAATYNGREAAQGRANRMSKILSSMHPRVFHAAGGKRYFVILGSGMTESEAERLCRQAIAGGAPADTYVTRLTEREE